MVTRAKPKTVATKGRAKKPGQTKKKVPAITATGTFVVGKTLPDKLPKATQEFFKTGVTPQKAYDIVARVKAVEAKSRAAEEKPLAVEAKPRRKARNVR